MRWKNGMYLVIRQVCGLSLLLAGSPSRSVNVVARLLPSSGFSPSQADLSVLVLPALSQRLMPGTRIAAHSQCRWPRHLPTLTPPTSTPWSATASHSASLSLLGDVKRCTSANQVLWKALCVPVVSNPDWLTKRWSLGINWGPPEQEQFLNWWPLVGNHTAGWLVKRNVFLC